VRIPMLTSVLCLGVSQLVCGQPITFQQKEDLTYEQRISKLEAERASLKEDVKNSAAEIVSLKQALSNVREVAKSADDRSNTNADDIGTIKWVGRVILGAVAFLIGVIVTQWVTKFMATRRSRVTVQVAWAWEGKRGWT
jgi:hypothetical protein